MDTQFVATVFGPERSGIMQTLADETHRLGGKWLDSRLSQLDGQFIGLIKIDIPQENEQQLKSFFQSQQDINSQFNDVSNVSAHTRSLTVHFDAQDRAGLVSEISNLFRKLGIDVDAMEAHRVAVNELGGNMFTSQFELRVPVTCDLDGLEDSLKGIQADASINIE